MKRSVNVINNVLSMAITVGTVLLVTFICNERYAGEFGKIITLLIVGALLSAFLCTLCHELAHVLVGKKNGFMMLSMTVLFFKWTKVKDKLRFDFVMMGEEGGYSETVPTCVENLDKRFKKMTSAGNKAVFVLMIIGIVPLFIKGLPLALYCIWAMLLPIGSYVFFGNALPMVSNGVRNDGAVLMGYRKSDDEWKNTLALLSISAEMYTGKTPCEVDERYYFDVPVLAEDNPVFIMHLNALYNYYLDKEDYEKAKETEERLMGLIDYAQKYVSWAIKTDALYNACTFDFNEKKADDLMYELEKYLNNVNSLTNVRVKMAYLIYVRREKDNLDIFYRKCVREINRCKIKGLALYENKLIEKMKKDF